jgi:hypothetical protein
MREEPFWASGAWVVFRRRARRDLLRSCASIRLTTADDGMTMQLPILHRNR